MSVNLTDPIFHNEDAARAHFEALHWPDGKPICPHCGVVGETTLLNGKSHRPGMYQCNACHEAVHSHSRDGHGSQPSAAYEMGARLSSDGVLEKGRLGSSANEDAGHRFLSNRVVSWRIAFAKQWPFPIRNRLAARARRLRLTKLFIGQPDQTFVSGKGWQAKRGTATKRKVLTMVERRGRAVSVKVEDLTVDTLKTVIGKTVILDSDLNTDEAQHYKSIGKKFASHDAVNHSAEEYARREGDKLITTNTVEGYFWYLQAWHGRRLSALLRIPFAEISERV